MGSRGKINAIWWNIKVNRQKLADVCEYELPTNLQNFTQKDLTEIKISQNVLGGGGDFFEIPGTIQRSFTYLCFVFSELNSRKACSRLDKQ